MQNRVLMCPSGSQCPGCAQDRKRKESFMKEREVQDLYNLRAGYAFLKDNSLLPAAEREVYRKKYQKADNRWNDCMCKTLLGVSWSKG